MHDVDSSARLNVNKRGVVVDIELEAPAEALGEVEEDVRSEEQLLRVPAAYLSGDAARPLIAHDAQGNAYSYVLRPMMYSVVLILLQEALERMAFYGVSNTIAPFLQGSYGTWNPGYSLAQALSLSSTTAALASTMPFVGALLADSVLGCYWTIVIFGIIAYLPGLLLIALSAKPYALGEVFNVPALLVGLLGLYPLGAGALKSCVNVFGAQQFHPVVQREQIKTYYVLFYGMINFGALVGGMTIPVVLRSDPFAAYMIPFTCFAVSLALFVAGSRRYVKMKPQGKVNIHFVPATCSALARCPPSLEASKRSRGGHYEDRFVDNCRTLLSVFPVNALALPFAVCYAQIGNGLSSQGLVMAPAGFVDAAWMTNFDCFGVLGATAVLSFVLFPWLARHGKTWALTTRFAIGSSIAVVALAYTIALDYHIRSTFAATGEQVSVALQAPAYLLIGVGEVFTFSASYEAAFTIAPKSMKSLASAINIFLIGAMPQYISTLIINLEAAWFRTPDGITKLNTIDAYCEAKTIYFWWTIFSVALIGVLLNLLPPVQRFVAHTTALAKECNAEHEADGPTTAGRGAAVSVADADDAKTTEAKTTEAATVL